MPQGLWQKCPGCSAVVHEIELAQNQRVCPHCDHHFPQSARERLADLLDPESFNERDFALKLPRQSPWTYGAAVTLDTPIGNGVLSSRASYSHRDRAFHTDNNLGFYEPYDLFDVNFSYTPAS